VSYRCVVLCGFWGYCGWQSCEYDGCHLCLALQCVVCFWLCMVCLVLEMGLGGVCGVCL